MPIAPYYGAGPVAQDQIAFVNTGSMIFTENGNRFTGYIPDDTNFVAYPKSLAGGLGLGLWCLDPEGITRAADIKGMRGLEAIQLWGAWKGGGHGQDDESGGRKHVRIVYANQMRCSVR